MGELSPPTRKYKFPSPGRLDVNGVEWWACDPYPTWFRWEDGHLYTNHAAWTEEEYPEDELERNKTSCERNGHDFQIYGPEGREYLLCSLCKHIEAAAYSESQQVTKRTPNVNVFLQWKGIDICCDLNCECGHHSHFDGDFAHVLRCPKCGELWELPHRIVPTQPARTDITPKEASPEYPWDFDETA